MAKFEKLAQKYTVDCPILQRECILIAYYVRPSETLYATLQGYEKSLQQDVTTFFSQLQNANDNSLADCEISTSQKRDENGYCGLISERFLLENVSAVPEKNQTAEMENDSSVNKAPSANEILMNLLSLIKIFGKIRRKLAKWDAQWLNRNSLSVKINQIGNSKYSDDTYKTTKAAEGDAMNVGMLATNTNDPHIIIQDSNYDILQTRKRSLNCVDESTTTNTKISLAKTPCPRTKHDTACVKMPVNLLNCSSPSPSIPPFFPNEEESNLSSPLYRQTDSIAKEKLCRLGFGENTHVSTTSSDICRYKVSLFISNGNKVLLKVKRTDLTTTGINSGNRVAPTIHDNSNILSNKRQYNSKVIQDVVKMVSPNMWLGSSRFETAQILSNGQPNLSPLTKESMGQPVTEVPVGFHSTANRVGSKTTQCSNTVLDYIKSTEAKSILPPEQTLKARHRLLSAMLWHNPSADGISVPQDNFHNLQKNIAGDIHRIPKPRDVTASKGVVKQSTLSCEATLKCALPVDPFCSSTASTLENNPSLIRNISNETKTTYLSNCTSSTGTDSMPSTKQVVTTSPEERHTHYVSESRQCTLLNSTGIGAPLPINSTCAESVQALDPESYTSRSILPAFPMNSTFLECLQALNTTEKLPNQSVSRAPDQSVSRAPDQAYSQFVSHTNGRHGFSCGPNVQIGNHSVLTPDVWNDTEQCIQPESLKSYVLHANEVSNQQAEPNSNLLLGDSFGPNGAVSPTRVESLSQTDILAERTQDIQHTTENFLGQYMFDLTSKNAVSSVGISDAMKVDNVPRIGCEESSLSPSSKSSFNRNYLSLFGISNGTVIREPQSTSKQLLYAPVSQADHQFSVANYVSTAHHSLVHLDNRTELNTEHCTSSENQHAAKVAFRAPHSIAPCVTDLHKSNIEKNEHEQSRPMPSCTLKNYSNVEYRPSVASRQVLMRKNNAANSSLPSGLGAAVVPLSCIAEVDAVKNSHLPSLIHIKHNKRIKSACMDIQNRRLLKIKCLKCNAVYRRCVDVTVQRLKVHCPCGNVRIKDVTRGQISQGGSVQIFQNKNNLASTRIVRLQRESTNVHKNVHSVTPSQRLTTSSASTTKFHMPDAVGRQPINTHGITPLMNAKCTDRSNVDQLVPATLVTYKNRTQYDSFNSHIDCPPTSSHVHGLKSSARPSPSSNHTNASFPPVLAQIPDSTSEPATLNCSNSTFGGSRHLEKVVAQRDPHIHPKAGVELKHCTSPNFAERLQETDQFQKTVTTNQTLTAVCAKCNAVAVQSLRHGKRYIVNCSCGNSTKITLSGNKPRECKVFFFNKENKSNSTTDERYQQVALESHNFQHLVANQTPKELSYSTVNSFNSKRFVRCGNQQRDQKKNVLSLGVLNKDTEVLLTQATRSHPLIGNPHGNVEPELTSGVQNKSYSPETDNCRSCKDTNIKSPLRGERTPSMEKLQITEKSTVVTNCLKENNFVDLGGNGELQCKTAQSHLADNHLPQNVTVSPVKVTEGLSLQSCTVKCNDANSTTSSSKGTEPKLAVLAEPTEETTQYGSENQRLVLAHVVKEAVDLVASRKCHVGMKHSSLGDQIKQCTNNEPLVRNHTLTDLLAEEDLHITANEFIADKSTILDTCNVNLLTATSTANSMVALFPYNELFSHISLNECEAKKIYLSKNNDCTLSGKKMVSTMAYEQPLKKLKLRNAHTENLVNTSFGSKFTEDSTCTNNSESDSKDMLSYRSVNDNSPYEVIEGTTPVEQFPTSLKTQSELCFNTLKLPSSTKDKPSIVPYEPPMKKVKRDIIRDQSLRIDALACNRSLLCNEQQGHNSIAAKYNLGITPCSNVFSTSLSKDRTNLTAAHEQSLKKVCVAVEENETTQTASLLQKATTKSVRQSALQSQREQSVQQGNVFLEDTPISSCTEEPLCTELLSCNKTIKLASSKHNAETVIPSDPFVVFLEQFTTSMISHEKCDNARNLDSFRNQILLKVTAVNKDSVVLEPHSTPQAQTNLSVPHGNQSIHFITFSIPGNQQSCKQQDEKLLQDPEGHCTTTVSLNHDRPKHSRQHVALAASSSTTMAISFQHKSNSAASCGQSLKQVNLHTVTLCVLRGFLANPHVSNVGVELMSHNKQQIYSESSNSPTLQVSAIRIHLTDKQFRFVPKSVILVRRLHFAKPSPVMLCGNLSLGECQIKVPIKKYVKQRSEQQIPLEQLDVSFEQTAQCSKLDLSNDPPNYSLLPTTLKTKFSPGITTKLYRTAHKRVGSICTSEQPMQKTPNRRTLTAAKQNIHFLSCSVVPFSSEESKPGHEAAKLFSSGQIMCTQSHPEGQSLADKTPIKQAAENSLCNEQQNPVYGLSPLCLDAIPYITAFNNAFSENGLDVGLANEQPMKKVRVRVMHDQTMQPVMDIIMDVTDLQLQTECQSHSEQSVTHDNAMVEGNSSTLNRENLLCGQLPCAPMHQTTSSAAKVKLLSARQDKVAMVPHEQLKKKAPLKSTQSLATVTSKDTVDLGIGTKPQLDANQSILHENKTSQDTKYILHNEHQIHCQLSVASLMKTGASSTSSEVFSLAVKPNDKQIKEKIKQGTTHHHSIVESHLTLNTVDSHSKLTARGQQSLAQKDQTVQITYIPLYRNTQVCRQNLIAAEDLSTTEICEQTGSSVGMCGQALTNVNVRTPLSLFKSLLATQYVRNISAKFTSHSKLKIYSEPLYLMEDSTLQLSAIKVHISGKKFRIVPRSIISVRHQQLHKPLPSILRSITAFLKANQQ